MIYYTYIVRGMPGALQEHRETEPCQTPIFWLHIIKLNKKLYSGRCDACHISCFLAKKTKEEKIMAAEVETMFYTRQAPWHGLGTRVMEALASGEALFPCGVGLVALTLNDIDFMNKQIYINKTYYRVDGKDVIATPKTAQSVRIIDIPDFLNEEIREYTKKLYNL